MIGSWGVVGLAWLLGAAVLFVLGWLYISGTDRRWSRTDWLAFAETCAFWPVLLVVLVAAMIYLHTPIPPFRRNADGSWYRP
jgi:hypothetical protein